MYRIVPLDLSASGRITSSTLAEPATGAETAWSSGGSYTVGQEVIRTATHRVYKCVAAHSGRTTAPEADPTYWLDVRPTLKWAPFDGSTTAPARRVGDLTYVLRPGLCNALTLHGLVGVSATLTVRNGPGGPVVHTESQSLLEPGWGLYEFLYFEPEQKPAVIFAGLPLLVDPEITLTVTPAAGAAAEIGMLVVGHLRSMLDGATWGGVEDGASAEPITRSYIETDDYGNTVIVPRPSSTNLTWSANLNVQMADAAISRLRRLLDVPAVWVADLGDNYTGLLSFGLASGRVTYGPTTAKITLNVKGLF